MSSLHESLKLLNGCCFKDGEINIYEAGKQVKNIEVICSRDLTLTQIKFYSSLLFNSEEGIVNVLNKNVTKGQFKGIRDQVLNFLKFFLSCITNHVFLHSEVIVKVCINVFRKDKYSKNKCMALNILQHLISHPNYVKSNLFVNELQNILNQELAKTSSNTTSSVKGQCLITLGFLAHHHPDIMMQKFERLFEIFFRDLQKEMGNTSRGCDLKVLEGSMIGLNHLLYSFDLGAEENQPSQRCVEVFKLVCMSLEPQDDAQRVAVPIAGLELFQNHAAQFGDLLINNYLKIDKILQHWFEHRNSQLKHASHMALDSFFYLVATQISEESSSDKYKTLFKYFIVRFKNTINQHDLNSKSMSLAVKGYGLFAGACKRFLSESDVNFMFAEILNRCENIFLNDQNAINENKIHQLPTYIQSLASITKQMNTNTGPGLSEKYLLSLCRLCVILIEYYPRLNKKFTFYCHSSFLAIAQSFSTHPDTMQRFLKKTVYQGLIRCCSHDNLITEDGDLVGMGKNQVTNEVENDTRTISYKDYIPLWAALIGGKKMIFEKNSVCAAYTVAFVNSVILIIEKLNLVVSNKDQDDTSSLSIINFEAQNSTDYKVFINLVGLCSELLPLTINNDSCGTSVFINHLPVLVHMLVLKSKKFSYVSGFYKLLSTIVTVARNVNYFAEIDSKNKNSEVMETETNNCERQNVALLIQEFSIKVALNLKQCKDELLASCLFFILNLPSEVIPDLLSYIVDGIQTSLELGISFLPLAETTIKSLERWRHILLKRKSVLQQIVPFLLQFLISSSKEEKELIQDHQKLKKKKISEFEEQREPAGKRVCLLVMRFLGSLGGDLVSYSHTKTLPSAVALWDKNISVEYAIPFRDMKPVIRLEKLLPRIMEIATSSGKRKAKISSCELLHSITLYIVGREAQMKDLKRDHFLITKLYKNLFPVILKLSCDMDKVCRQMFELLMTQMIHWFTSPNQLKSPMTDMLLRSIMNGLVETTDLQIRERSAKFLNEYLLWSFKQNTTQTEKTCANVTSIFKKIYSYALHPSSVKRLGACLAFNNFYTTFREQNILVDQFTLEMLVIFVECLKFFHDDSSSDGGSKSCVLAIGHLEKIIKVKCELFNKTSELRRKPKGFEHLAQVTLIEICEWLFKQCGKRQTECRHQCMHLCLLIIKLLPGNLRSPTLWIENQVKKHGNNFLINMFECEGEKQGGLIIYSTPVLMSDKLGLKSIQNWFDLVLAALEVYTWVLEERLIKFQLLFNNFTTGSKLFESLKYFMENIANFDALSVLKTLTDNKDLSYVSPHDSVLFNTQKCTVITRLLQFVCTYIKCSSTPVDQTHITKTHIMFWNLFLDLLSSVIFCPSTLGFETIDNTNVVDNLSSILQPLVLALIKNTSPVEKKLFLKKLKENPANHSLVEILPSPFGKSQDSKNLNDLLSGYSLLHKCALLQEVLNTSEVDKNTFSQTLLQLTLDSVIKYDGEKYLASSMSTNEVNLGKRLLKLSFDLGFPMKHFIEQIESLSVKEIMVDGKQTTTQLSLFLSSYSDLVYKEFCLIPTASIVAICGTNNQQIFISLLLGILERLFSDRVLRKKQESKICDLILLEWDQKLQNILEITNTEILSNMIVIILKIISLNPLVCSDSKHKSHNAVLKMFELILSSNTFALTFKTEALELLSFFLMSSEHSTTLQKHLENLVANHFPLSSKEFPQGSSQLNNYSNAMEKLIYSMKETGNLMLMQLLMNILTRESDHLFAKQILAAFQESIQNVSSAEQKNALNIPYQYYANSSHSINMRQLAINQVLVALATKCDVTSVIEFYVEHICEIINVIKEEWLQNSTSKWSDQLERKTLAYRLLELMFSILPEQHFSPSSSIGRVFAKSNENSVLKTFMQRANRDKNENMKGEEDLLEHRRRFHCSVYNALIAALMCTKTDIKWYKAFLFDENTKKHQYLLDNVIDQNIEYKFEIEIDEPLQTRKRFVAIRNSQKEKQKDKKVVSYISSLADSSLSEDVTLFDSNLARTLSSQELSDQLSSEKMQTETTSESNLGSYIELDGDDLNNHECMPSLVALITHLTQNSIGFSDKEDQLPPWMDCFSKKLSSSLTHPNIRLFITKLIINCQSTFRKYASFFLEPILQTIVRGDCGKRGIDTMTCDVMATVLSWNNIAIPSDDTLGKSLVESVIKKLSQNVKASSRPIIRHNLDLIKTTMECWSARIKDQADSSVIYGLLSDSFENDGIENYAALQLMGVYLSDEISLYNPLFAVGRLQYYSRIFANLSSKKKDIYLTTSEVMGMTLKLSSLKENENEGEIHDLVTEKLHAMSRNKQDKFIYCLEKVSYHYPPIVEKFLSKIFFELPKLHGDLRTLSLEIIEHRAPEIKDLFIELKSAKLMTFMSIRDTSLQLVCLKLCRHIFENSKQETIAVRKIKINYFVEQVLKIFASHSSVLCRQEAFDLMALIYDYQISLKSCDHDDKITATSKCFLLNCLDDQEQTIRNQALNFWSDEQHIPIDPSKKLLAILRVVFDQSLSETQFLSNSVNLLLQSSSLSPDFERSLFEHPLSDCVFKEYVIDNSWKNRHSNMTPMFSTSLQFDSYQSKDENLPFDQNANQLMATQKQLQFTATMNANARNTYDWTTGSSLDTFASLAINAEPQHKSSLIVNIPSMPKQQFSKAKLNVQDIKMLESNQEKEDKGINIDVQRIRRRFRKENEENKWRFARYHQMQNKKKKIQKREERGRLENSVQLYRKYRSGDLPDIQIPHRALVAPLAVACQHDSTLAQLVLTLLTSSILSEEKNKNETEIVLSIFNQFSSVLMESKEKSSNLIAFIANLFIQENKDVNFIDELTQSCLASNNQALALFLLEQKLINKQQAIQEPSTKRRKMEHQEDSELFETWMQVARIYKLFDDVDMLPGIFHGRSLPDTVLGLNMENESKFKEAAKVYQQALKKEDENIGELEKDVWEDCLINCFQNLTKWDSINKFCDGQLSSFCDENSENVTLLQSWNYPRFQERFLKPSLQSKLYLLLDGNENVANELANYFDDALTANDDKEYKNNYVKKNYADYLAMLFVFKGDYGQGRFYLQSSFNNFMTEWSTINPLMKEQKFSILRKIPTLSDLHDFLDLMEKPDGEFTFEAVKGVLSDWLNRTPNLTQDSILTWHHSVIYRTFFQQQFKDRLNDLNLVDDHNFLEEFQVNLKLKMAENACNHHNFIVAGKLLRQLEEKEDMLTNAVTKVKLSLNIARYYHAQERFHVDNYSKQLKFMQASHVILSECNNEVFESNTNLEVDHLILLADTYHKTLNSFLNMDVNNEVEEEIIEMLPSQYSESSHPLKIRLEKSAFGFYNKAVSIKSNMNQQHKALMALAQFCDTSVIALQNTNDDSDLMNKYVISMTSAVLKAIKLQPLTSNAILKFPRLLQIIVEVGGDMLSIFTKQSKDIPTWVFLSWVGHMIALLDNKVAYTVHDILKRILNDYPQALVYPFLTACEGFHFQSCEHEKRNKLFVKSLKSELRKKVPLANKFVEELQCLTHPVLVFKDWKADFFRNYQENHSAKLHQNIGNYQRMYEKLFNCEANQEESSLYDSSSPMSQHEPGIIYSKFSNKFKTSMDNIFGQNGVKISSLKLEDCRRQFRTLDDDFDKFQKTNRPKTLKDMSPWLNNFSLLQHQNYTLEIPGQYNEHSRPLPEYHVNIVGFDEKIKVMPSIRQPCKITMMGSDEKEYHFLVKGGEDLRQDQRISQIFDSMNKILNEDLKCRKQGLFIVNYKVIPVNCKVGIIEWMNDVSTFLETLQKIDKKSISNLLQLSWVPEALVKKFGSNNYKACYGELMKVVNYSDVKDKFTQNQLKIPWDLLRRAYLQMSENPESFLVLRKRYTSSLATMSITNWLLGIGDRHTQNIMISTSTGFVVGIDFGHAFGSATELLPIPELIPFRMTRQMVGLLAPYSAQHGELRQMMITCLTSLRLHDDALLSLLDVFVKDPSVDWIKYALQTDKRPKSIIQSKGNANTTMEFAERKLKVVKRKLSGGNPAAITTFELSYNLHIREYKKYYCAVAKGRPGKNVRAKENDDNLSPSTQVDCLIDQALDPNILGRCYSGWKSWL